MGTDNDTNEHESKIKEYNDEIERIIKSKGEESEVLSLLHLIS